MTEKEKKLITREKHRGRVVQGHKLVALMKKRKEEILRSKDKFTEQSTVQSTVQSIIQSTVQSTEQTSVQSNGVYGDYLWRWYTCGPCHWCLCTFTYNKKAGQVIHEEPIKPKRRHML